MASRGRPLMQPWWNAELLNPKASHTLRCKQSRCKSNNVHLTRQLREYYKLQSRGMISPHWTLVFYYHHLWPVFTIWWHMLSIWWNTCLPQCFPGSNGLTVALCWAHNFNACSLWGQLSNWQNSYVKAEEVNVVLKVGFLRNKHLLPPVRIQMWYNWCFFGSNFIKWTWLCKTVTTTLQTCPCARHEGIWGSSYICNHS
jgi:hypothetical protein